MTQEEAIERLERLKRNCHDLAICSPNGKGWALQEMSLSMALTALRFPPREMVERMRGEWRECFEDWRKQIVGDQCSKCGFQHYGTSINHYHFCPACGAPMTDEAVDILLKRLEALYETT